MLKKAKTIIKKILKMDTDSFLNEVNGVLHIGANSGQERQLYHQHNLNVIWVEPIPEIFAQLQDNIKPYPKQLAFQELITDNDEKEYEFKIANNNGTSSSILDLKDHEKIWDEVSFTKSIQLKSITLPSFFKKENLSPEKYQALIMDTQGSELLVLKGAGPSLKNFKFIKTEAPDFEAYTGCCLISDIENFMNKMGFREIKRKKFAGKSGIGNYFDVVYQRRD